MTDKQFVNAFSLVIVALVAITALILIAATLLSSIHAEMDHAMRQSMEERLTPIGKVNIGSVAIAKTAAGTTATTGKAAVQPVMDGRSVYNTVCSACHLSGALNAPIFGNKALWAPRISQGVEVLYAAALHGKGAMPAKGGRADMSDELIKSAVDYMLKAVR